MVLLHVLQKENETLAYITNKILGKYTGPTFSLFTRNITLGKLHVLFRVFVCVRVRACVCVRERETDRQRQKAHVNTRAHVQTLPDFGNFWFRHFRLTEIFKKYRF